MAQWIIIIFWLLFCFGAYAPIGEHDPVFQKAKIQSLVDEAYRLESERLRRSGATWQQLKACREQFEKLLSYELTVLRGGQPFGMIEAELTSARIFTPGGPNLVSGQNLLAHQARVIEFYNDEKRKKQALELLERQRLSDDENSERCQLGYDEDMERCLLRFEHLGLIDSLKGSE